MNRQRGSLLSFDGSPKAGRDVSNVSESPEHCMIAGVGRAAMSAKKRAGSNSKTAAARRKTAARSNTGKANGSKRKTSAKRKTQTANAAAKQKQSAKKKQAKALSRNRIVRKTASPRQLLGRPQIAGTAELELMFRKDREAREVFEFLGVKTVKELESLSPDDIVAQLTAPLIRTVGRIRKSLAMSNRCLAGDQKFALAFKKQLS